MRSNQNRQNQKYLLFFETRYEAEQYFFKVFFLAITLVKWLVISIGTGLIVGAVASCFAHALSFANDFRTAHPVIILALPLGGMLIVFLYRFFKNTQDQGTNMVISSIHSSTNIPLRMAPLIFISTVITHLLGGSAGREGAAIQLGGSIANRLGKILHLNENDRHIIIMSGMSAGFSALFGTPMAAAIFALEVESIGIMHYSALVPSVTAAMIAHFVAVSMKVPPEVFVVGAIPVMEVGNFFRTVLFAAVAGIVSILFCVLLHGAEHVYKERLHNPYARIGVAGCLVVALAASLQTDFYLGSGMNIIVHIFQGGEIEPYTFLLKMIFTALTLGAGYKGGEIVPSFCVGAAFGYVAACFFGLSPALTAACGMIGLFCGVTNCPITSLLISFELFGFEGMPYYLVTVAVSYLLSGYYGLYHAQKIMYSKTETNFVNKVAQ